MPAQRFPVIILGFLAAALVYPQDPQTKSEDKDPCFGSGTQYEVNQCMQRRSQIASQRLNDLYKRIENSMQSVLSDARNDKSADQVKYAETGLKNLRQAEAAWTAYRDAHCEAARQRFEGGTIAPAVYSGCVCHITEHRIDELKEAYGDDLGEW
jgi:uncharacterized protein YecT (DUF1311 family)